LKSNTK